MALARVHLARQDPDGAEALLQDRNGLAYQEQAEQELERLLHLTGRGRQAAHRYRPDSVHEVHQRIVSSGYRIDSALEQAAEHLLQRPLLSDNNRYALESALARVLDQRGEHRQALHRMARAQAVPARLHPYDAAGFEALVDDVIRVFDEALIRRLRGAGSTSRRPVFIVGMPRSGTSLVEQILAGHPGVFAAGELSYVAEAARSAAPAGPYPATMTRLEPAHLAAASNAYLAQIDALDDRSPRLTDKLPHNFLRIGLIDLMFPHASIIHVQRDPRDVAASNYFARFGLRGDLMAYHSGIDSIEHHLRHYRRLMQHWRRLLPGRMVEIHYETLVTDPGATAARLLEAIGLEWDDAVLASHRLHRPVDTASTGQVTEPVYRSSVGRWQRYGDGTDNPFARPGLEPRA